MGTAVLLGAPAALACLRPGNVAMERLLVRTALGDIRVPFECRDAIAYRLAAPQADHYFLINDGPARSVSLRFEAFEYERFKDPVTGAALDPAALALAADDALWVRAIKAADA